MVFMDIPYGANMHILWRFRIKWRVVMTMMVGGAPFIKKVVKHTNVRVVRTCDCVIISLQHVELVSTLLSMFLVARAVLTLTC